MYIYKFVDFLRLSEQKIIVSLMKRLFLLTSSRDVV